MNIVTLNWRHKAGLLLALTATGVGLLLELSAKQTSGIAVLGIAFAWLIGTFSTRTVGLASLILISALGLYVAAGPVWGDWRSFRQSANTYDSAIAELVLAVKGVVGHRYEIVSPQGVVWDQTVEVPEAAEKWVRPESADPSNGWSLVVPMKVDFPGNMSEADIMKTFETILLPRPTFSLAGTLRAHVWSLTGGLALFTAGLLGFVWLLRRGRRIRQDSA